MDSSFPSGLLRIVNRPDPQKGRISPRFTVQDFCYSTSSETSLHTTHLNHGDDFTASTGAVGPAKAPHQPEHAAGVARLINTWNPDITIKRSDSGNSDASKSCARADNVPSLFQESSSLPSAPSRFSMVPIPASPLPSQNARSSQRNEECPSTNSIQRLTVKRLHQLSRACFAAGERETPQWRYGPSGINQHTLQFLRPNVCQAPGERVRQKSSQDQGGISYWGGRTRDPCAALSSRWLDYCLGMKK
jgi:hypothetical protein